MNSSMKINRKTNKKKRNKSKFSVDLGLSYHADSRQQ